MSKLVSVVMSVYNTDERYLRGSIESILAQTYQYFEFIIVLDHPTDGLDQIVKEYESRDSRIVVLVNEQNLGLTKSLNIALGRARGEYIARMDADDYIKSYWNAGTLTKRANLSLINILQNRFLK